MVKCDGQNECKIWTECIFLHKYHAKLGKLIQK